MILVSAYIQPGTVFRAPEGFNRFDHTSMIKTICNKWNLPSDFGARAASPKTADASQALTLNEPRKRNQMPAFKPRPYVPWDLPSSHKHGLTAFQRDIAGLARRARRGGSPPSGIGRRRVGISAKLFGKLSGVERRVKGG